MLSNLSRSLSSRLRPVGRRSICFAFLLLLTATHALPDDNKPPIGVITFIDVGEGDAILLESKGRGALIDTGNPITGHRVLQLLRSKGLERLEAIILTHPHPDHFGGVFQILQSIAVGTVHDNGESLAEKARSEDLFRWYIDLVRKDSRYSLLDRGNKLEVGEFSLRVLWPGRGRRTTDWNTNSLVLIGELGTFKFLLMGDGNQKTEEYLQRDQKISATVLKVGHHGAADSASAKFLEAVRPAISVVSVDRENARGYPASETLARLRSVSKVYRTDVSGTISMNVFADGSYEVATEHAASEN